MIYFTSDLHFGHANILRLCNRPFNSIYEHDEALIANFNSVVKKDDEVYILGDLALSKNIEFVTNILNRLNGRKHYIIGNHDEWLKKLNYECDAFESIGYYKEIKYNKRKICLMHYPICDWNGVHHESLMLHGHQHNNAQYNIQMRDIEKIRRFDVGVDANNYKPVSIDKILDFMSKQENFSKVHHQ